MKKFLLFVIAAVLSLSASSQDKAAIDSLEANIDSMDGSAKAAALYDIIYFYMRTDREKGLRYLAQIRAFAENADDDVAVYYMLSRAAYLNRSGKIDSSVLVLEEAERRATRTDNYHALIRIYNGLAINHISSGRPEKGLEYLYKGLRGITKAPDIRFEMRFHTNIAWAFLELKQYRQCIDYGLQNIRRLEGTELEWIALYSYNNVAVSYGALNMLDSAKYFIGKGIDAARRNDDNQSLANGYFILGTIYSNAGQYDLAIEQYLKARPYRDKVGNPFFIVSDLYTISDLYFKAGKYADGVKAGREALKLAEQFNLSLKFEGTYLSLARNYEGLKDFANASHFYKMYASVKDTIYQNASSEAIAEMTTRFETEKKEKQLAIQKAELAEQRVRIQNTNMILAILALVLVLVIVIFTMFRNRVKRKQEMLEKEREILLREAQIQATIQSQERERKRFAQDLHDGMGQLISALRLALHGVNRESGMEERIEAVTKGETILDEMHHEIRSIAFNLMPQTLVQHGIVPALKEMGEKINAMGRIAISVSSYDMPRRLPEAEEISLYRIVQEWVNNIMKYAEATTIDVQLIAHETEINIIVEDNGRGFNTTVLEKGDGNGWKNIKSRLNLIRASIEIDSRENMTGTTVVIRLPVTQADSPAENAEAISLRVSPNTQ